jgi:hypothetical protein
VAVLLGGFLTNLAWCLPKLPNYLVCALAGGIWYFQFFFYTMGETQMGAYKFSSWTLHMASIIIFSSLWGIALHEWRGAGRRTKGLLALSLAFLLASTMIVGYGNYLGTVPSERGSAHVALYFGPLADGSVKKSTGVTLPGGRGSVTHCKYRSIFLNRAC